MAIDTAAKRASLIGYGLPFRLMLPFPDASIDLGDRQHLVGLYSGIEVEGPDVSGPSLGLVTIVPAYDGRAGVLSKNKGYATIITAYTGVVTIQ